MKRIICFALTVIMLLQVNGTAVEAAGSNREDVIAALNSRAAVLMDADTGRVLVEKNGNELLPMASTTKIMTAIIAIEKCSMDEIFTASEYAAGMPKVHMGVYKGQRFCLKDLLLGLMLESYNDAAVIIAEGVAGSVESFAALMNEKAREIGAAHTNFVTPNGLDSDGHQTTAADLALIMAYCIRNKTFIEITNTQTHTFSDADGKRSYSAVNHNAFLNSYDGAVSGKTGYTGKAGYCYVAAAKRGDKTFTIALLACGWPSNKTLKWKDSRLLFEYGFDNYEKKVVEISDISLSPIYVEKGIAKSVRTDIEDKVFKRFLFSDEDKLDIGYYYDYFPCAPVSNGLKVGRLIISVNDFVISEYTIKVIENDFKADFYYYLKKLVNYIYI